MNKLLISLLLVLSASGCTSGETGVRQAAVSGQFYPSSREKLEKAIDYFISDAVPPLGRRPIGLIVPHAGYIYSGQIAADGFRQAMEYDYDLIVILGTNHTTANFQTISVNPSKGYATPLGVTPVDTLLAEKLIVSSPKIVYNPAVHRKEHSVEVQVPFIQKLFPGVPILPVIVGSDELELCNLFADNLIRLLGNREALIVTSSDLSHYPDYDHSLKIDQATLEAAVSLDPVQFRRTIENGMRSGTAQLVTCACGHAPITACMVLASKLGARQGTLISYANSGETIMGTKERVVGYGAVQYSADEVMNPPDPFARFHDSETTTFPLSETERYSLLSLARKSITWYLTAEVAPLPRNLSPGLDTPCGAFVTIEKDRQLRGCIGHMAEDIPLAQCVGKMALEAALHDYRFSPLQPEELDEITLEISVLTPYTSIPSYRDIVLGRDGILLRKRGHSAVFLPQVAPEQQWNLEETLSHLSRKAGLPADGWQTGAEYFTFRAEVFRE